MALPHISNLVNSLHFGKYKYFTYIYKLHALYMLTGPYVLKALSH